MNYKRRPIEVQALQWSGTNFDLIQEFLIGADKTVVRDIDGELKLLSLDGFMTCHLHDYIIRTKHNEVYPCSQYSFKEIYEAV